MINVRNVIATTVVGTVVSILFLGAAVYKYGQKTQYDAIAFWGDSYDPNAPANPLISFPVSMIVPTGGPLISGAFTNCEDEFMHPVKRLGDGELKVMCIVRENGMYQTQTLTADDIHDDAIRDFLFGDNAMNL